MNESMLVEDPIPIPFELTLLSSYATCIPSSCSADELKVERNKNIQRNENIFFFSKV